LGAAVGFWRGEKGGVRVVLAQERSGSGGNLDFKGSVSAGELGAKVELDGWKGRPPGKADIVGSER